MLDALDASKARDKCIIPKGSQLARPSVSHANAKLEMLVLDCDFICMLIADCLAAFTLTGWSLEGQEAMIDLACQCIKVWSVTWSPFHGPCPDPSFCRVHEAC